MIKIERTQKPPELTESLQSELTKEFIQTNKSVWNIDFLKKKLLEYSNNKCCYCETNITEESKYLEVDHFHPKEKYKNEVLEWNNLLPSCKKCNGTKKDHDTILEPIIDPSFIDPKAHLKYWHYRIKGKDDLGKLTISVLNLNNPDRLVKKRYQIGNAVQEKLEELNELTNEVLTGLNTSTRRINRITNGLKDLMKEGLPNSAYSATTAAIILTNADFIELKNYFQTLRIWDSELIQLENDISKAALEIQA
ncbi:HNH endonuclease [Leptospira bourretii]|uniref:HNH endonuclease n=1 Tax=Leptospira bourretii TaxID=2484962 RepID=UPI001090CB6A|nr:HNH endonuclease [Leptospira bourretii]TGL19759.1 HNH endonuclease [Leptospira bourretii]